MQNKMLTPTECWEDFWEWYKTVRPARMPNELAVADLTHKGEVTKTNSRGEIVQVRLGPDRIARLLEKYAPGRYVLHPAYYTMA